MAETTRLICASDTLAEKGCGVRFELPLEGGAMASAFVVRYGGKAYAYLNRCAHVGIEIDWNAGEFFDDSGLYLICSTHGAIYRPDSGECMGGPCRGRRLQQLDIEERDGSVFLK
ncbi:MAG: Rieske 2Fe-2S domain-containing protein [Betaproteobacteria bacterium]|nr:Rieske 2Fe-2S domain-containing protein [Betaproteobacteria bacterium]